MLYGSRINGEKQKIFKSVLAWDFLLELHNEDKRNVYHSHNFQKTVFEHRIRVFFLFLILLKTMTIHTFTLKLKKKQNKSNIFLYF